MTNVCKTLKLLYIIDSEHELGFYVHCQHHREQSLHEAPHDFFMMLWAVSLTCHLNEQNE